LRDIVVTEYGVADLRSAQDEEVIQRLICIADSRWQDELRAAAIKAGKLDAAWSIPVQFRSNTPDWVQDCLGAFRRSGTLPEYPFGSDFTAEEQLIAPALAYLAERSDTRVKRLGLLIRALTLVPGSSQGSSAAAPGNPEDSRTRACMRRMGLENPVSWHERLERRLLLLALRSVGA
jgi:hypothetical protein